VPFDLTLLMLAAARALPFAWVMPLGGRDIPRAVSLSLVLAVASILYAFSPAMNPVPTGHALVLALAFELGVGAVLALACAAPFIALSWAGQLTQTSVLVQKGAEGGPLATLFRLAALNVFCMLGGHRALSAALVSSLDDVPLGLAKLRAEPLALGISQLFVDALSLGLALALPLLITLWIIDVGMTLVARTAGRTLEPVAQSSLRAAAALVVLALTFTPVIDAFPRAVRDGMASARSLLRSVAR